MADASDTSPPARPIPELQVDEEGGGLMIVEDEIRHQRVEHVAIDVHAGHRRYSN